MLAHRPILLTNIATLISGFALLAASSSSHLRRDRLGQRLRLQRQRDEGGALPAPELARDALRRPARRAIGRRYGSKWPLAIGMLIVSVAAFLFATMHAEPGTVLLASALLGLGVGAAFAAMAGLIADNVDPREMGVAAGMNTVVRMIGGSSAARSGRRCSPRARSATPRFPPSRPSRSRSRSAPSRLIAAGIAVSIGSRPARRHLERPPRPRRRRPPGRARFVLRADASSAPGRCARPAGPQHVITATEVTTHDRNPDKA